MRASRRTGSHPGRTPSAATRGLAALGRGSARWLGGVLVTVEQRLGRLPGDDRVGGAIGGALVLVALLPDAAVDVHTCALLDDVGRFMRGGVEVRRLAERDVVAGGERRRAHARARLGRRPADVRLDPGHVVTAEQALDPIEVGQRRRRTRDALGGERLDIARRRLVLTASVAAGSALTTSATGAPGSPA